MPTTLLPAGASPPVPPQQTDCGELGRTADRGAAVRDTKDRAAGVFTTTPAQWCALLAAVKAERFSA